jgi:hypothetical protein
MGPGKYLRQPRLLRRIYSYSGRQAFYVEIFGKDLTGNGVPNLVIRQWKGSAHGDSEYLVLEINDSVITETDIVDDLLDVKFQDLNNDGITEIAGLDKAYSYFLGDSFAASPCPLVVLSFDKIQAKFVPDKKLMSKRPWSQSQLDKLGLQYKNDPSWSEETRPPSEIFDTMLKLIYSGNEQQAWELFDASWPDAAKIPKEQYRRSIEVHSRKSLFYPVIAGWNKEKTEVLPVGQGN